MRLLLVYDYEVTLKYDVNFFQALWQKDSNAERPI